MNTITVSVFVVKLNLYNVTKTDTVFVTILTISVLLNVIKN